ncbi:sugar ABC transporter permease [Paradevosia shaoguanensis]|uniref:Xylose transport system permease protein XylH n=1 Tax=Paradevosia shaoguanensis TaxID=1335043 RepID=A0AA41QM99_9HYPH|nr:sugar ABC transporter permease [Paradevosia shaoguanensis]KFL28660.1 sugar ABC transporter permease [Devosia sp. 17-2-E-8]MCF1743003.1 sugar ABC transporter permease [Paradevosia shaoguanensis]MCI0127486.1 sugar ABC transporter permease [Paradevosia shaoguanensis]CDP53914.1 Ribose ABC transport system, permease protein RbsC [Devosia sp. DBB001]
MVDQHALPASPRVPSAGMGPIQRFLTATELDTRLLGMIGALLLIWLGFHFLSGGVFLTPRNLWNLSVQTASVAIMATGMVLVIVTRNIDLSVGSILGVVGMLMGVMQVDFLPRYLGLGHPAIWILTLAFGLVVGMGIGALQGIIIAYLRVPAFIVTLGGYLIWRGAAWWVTSGRTVAPLDQTFQLMGGGPAGSIGFWASWAVGALICIGIIAGLYIGRRQRRRFNFPQRPIWAEVTLGVLGCGIALAAVGVANAYPWPSRIAANYAAANNITVPEGGLFISHGIAIPVLIALAAGIVMTFIATRTRFGRYVFAMGGNPEAAELAGINTRWVTVKIFILMGALCAVAAAISSARLNAATNALGTFDELYVIAAAVIGGTSLAGGVGTIVGAMIGALVMQSLQSGMVLMGIDSPLQSIVVGIVLVLAVWLDTLYRRKSN